MQNDKGEYVDLYVPRKCSATNRIIAAKDHSSVQLAIAEVDPKTGMATGKVRSYALCGEVRRMGEADDSINHLAKRDGLLSKHFKQPGLDFGKKN